MAASVLQMELDSIKMKETNYLQLIDNKIYFIGGNNGKPLSQIETFDLTTEKWGFPGELFTPLERPAIAYNNNIIYFFEDRKIYTYELKTKQLKEFEIELESKRAAMYYYDNKLYIIGGRIDNSYSQVPSSKVYSVDINEFETTKPNRIKTLDSFGFTIISPGKTKMKSMTRIAEAHPKDLIAIK